jgi:membrane-associated phospholipid phosphatase
VTRRMSIRALASLALVAVLLISIRYLDRPLAVWAAGLDPLLRAACARLTLLGDSKWYLVPLALATPALYLASRQSRDAERSAYWRGLMWAAIFVFLAIALSGIAADLLKILFGRARPPLALGTADPGWQPFSLKAKFHSFPSGHANTVFALAAALGMLWRRLRWTIFAFAVLIAATRIIVGAHYLADTIAGAALALGITAWLREGFRRRGLLFTRAGASNEGATRRVGRSA